ncbi:MAG: 30S ribosomal protein S6, partial [Ignavibacteriales bacterium]|nr:30S ribosomal protein S6 [Ignavibacteriales bacterium]
ATLEDTQVDVIIEKVKEVIAKNGGQVLAAEKWGRKRLTYTIRKKNNGFYMFFEFKAPGDAIAKIERHYQLDEQVLRYLTVKLDKKALKAKAVKIAAAAALAAAEPQPVVAPPVVVPPVAAQ